MAASPAKPLSRRQVASNVDSHPKLGKSAQESDAVSLFFTWAVGRWSMLREIFKLYDTTSKYCTFRTVSAREFVEFLWWHGFEGNALEVFQEIALEAPGPGQGTQGQKGNFGEISLAQLHRFEKRNADLAKGVDTPVVRFTRALRKSRGSLLRAWRLDLDQRGAGLVAYADFVSACRRLGFGGETKVLWNSFRAGAPASTQHAPLEFREFDKAEAANLDTFAEVLWSTTDFDLSRAWTCIDPLNRGVVTLEEFQSGAQMLGFEGNVRLLFKGLDTTGLGKLRRQELDYLQVLSLSSSRTQYCAPAIRSLNKFVQVELGGPNALLTKLGLHDGSTSMSSEDLALNLKLLGYRGDSKRIVELAAKIGGGGRVTGELLYGVLAGVGGHATSPEAAVFQTPPPPRASAKPLSLSPTALQFRPEWRDGLDDFAASNVEVAHSQRKYFSTPTGGTATLLQPDGGLRRMQQGYPPSPSILSQDWERSPDGYSPGPWSMRRGEFSEDEVYDDQRMLYFKAVSRQHHGSQSARDLAAHQARQHRTATPPSQAASSSSQRARSAHSQRDMARGGVDGSRSARELQKGAWDETMYNPSQTRYPGGRSRDQQWVDDRRLDRSGRRGEDEDHPRDADEEDPEERERRRRERRERRAKRRETRALRELESAAGASEQAELMTGAQRLAGQANEESGFVDF